MKKKILSLLLALCLVMALVPMTAFAEGTSVDNWDGSADTSWYTSAPDASEYHISTAEQLAGLAQLVNADPGTTNFAGKTFYLDNDIDLSGHEWISIGTVLGGDYPEYSFCGVFDGQGHVISNLYSHESYIEGADESHNLLRNALFGSVYNGEVKNLGVADAEIWIDPKDDSAAGKGILVDWMGKSKITNCWTSGSIYSGTKIEKNIGGIVGVTMQGCTISGCYSTATLTGNFTNSEGYYTEPNPADWPCDTIGGIVGARFDGDLTVTDCWFDGKIVVNSITAAVGGIVGYTDDQLGSGTVNNCMVTTTDMGVDNDGNTCWVAYALDGTVENCCWPNNAKAYDPSPLAYVGGQSNEEQGTAISDFTSADVLAGLKNNAGAGVEWVAGIGHPTFVWDDNNILADYTAVEAAIARATALDSSLYTNYSAVEDAINSVDRAKSKAQQTEVDAMAKAIEDAVSALQYKGAYYTKVDAAIAKANALNKDNYKDFTAVEAAVKAVVRDKNITEQSEVDAMAKAIEDAIAALQYKGADYTKVDEAIAKVNALNKDNYKDFSGVEAAVNAVVRGKNITEQSEVDKMAKAIEKAIDALQYKGADYTKVDEAIGKEPEPSNDSGDSNNTGTNGENAVHTHTYTSAVTKAPTTTEEGIMTYTCTTCGNVFAQPIAKIASAAGTSDSTSDGTSDNTSDSISDSISDSSKNIDSHNNSDTETKPYIKDDSGKKGWDVIRAQLDEAKSGEMVTVAMNGTTVVPKDIFDSIKGEDVTLVLDMGNGISWKINGRDITEPSGDIDFGVTVGADAGKSIPVDVINNVTGERYSMNLSLAYNGEFGFTAILTINMESKNAGLYANLFYYNEQTGELEFVSAGQIDADGKVELEFTHASDYMIVIDVAVMDGGNKDSINTTKDNGNAEDNTAIPASNADNAKSDAWNPAIIIIIVICILLIVSGAAIFVSAKKGHAKPKKGQQ